MSSLVKVIDNDSHFQMELSNAGTKLVVVDFTASWCGPCQRIAPIFEQLSAKYTQAVFLKVDVDKCQDTAAGQGVSAMPTFIFYRNKCKLGTVQGADATSLENKIKQLAGSSHPDEEEEEEGASVPGHMDLSSFILKQQTECLNESDHHNIGHALNKGSEYLESDVDEQLIISLTFSQAVKIHSLRFKAPKELGPKNVNLFINQPMTLDFDTADSCQPVQSIELSSSDLEGTPVRLQYVKFQNVGNLQLFIKDNQSGAETTRIDFFTVIGSPITTTNMGEFKRVSGKKGESH